jgi:hypothetical protein
VLKSAVLLLAVILGALGVQAYINNLALQGFVVPKNAALDSFDQKAVDISIETVRSLTTMATLVFGAVGAFWFTKYSSVSIPPKVWKFGLAAAMFAGLSIYFGYVFERGMIIMLTHRLVALQKMWFVWPLYAEVSTFLISLFALGAVIFEGRK